MVKVLGGLQQKSILSPSAVAEIDACLKERDNPPPQSDLSPTEANGQAAGEANHQVTQGPSISFKPNGVARLDKRQVEQRIEEDRERHKRLREYIWAVDDDGGGEFEKLWDEASDIGEDDYLGAEEDALERRQAIEAE